MSSHAEKSTAVRLTESLNTPQTKWSDAEECNGESCMWSSVRSPQGSLADMHTRNLLLLPSQLCSCYLLAGIILLPSILSVPVENDDESSDIVITNSSNVVETAGSVSSGSSPVLIEPIVNLPVSPFANISSNVTARLHEILGNATERNRLLTRLFGVDVANSNPSLPELLQTLRANGSLNANATAILRQARQFGYGGFGRGGGSTDALLLALLLSDRGGYRGGFGFGGGYGGYYPPPFYGNSGGGSSSSSSSGGMDFGQLALLSLLGLALISRFPTQG
ncbi:hypothetical protein RvY_07273 [Ramazzottius varieornatus]|uniref:Uncharacterized protein n=1 Tax=Ramazzottius varieornatus TaxID=947166 RepID=A0A1D1V4R0_RAMVA|nr:hypothetical protein RvY_07273 [Ramazzottius varieornatus]